MKLSNYILIFLMIFVTFATCSFYYIDIESKANIVETEYGNRLTSACEDAIKTINAEAVETGSAWKQSVDREQTADIFYNSLTLGFNDVDKEKLKYAIPVLCLIDLDGFYLSYNSLFAENVVRDDINRIDRDEITGSATTITGLNTWSKKYNDNTIVRFYLSDNIEIITSDNKVFKGDRASVLADYQNNGGADINDIDVDSDGDGTTDYSRYVSVISLLSDYDKFNQERNNVIVSAINEQILYYINQLNYLSSDFDIPYEYEMPTIADEDWHRLLQRPTVIGFLQGVQMSTKNDYVNIYSLAGGELIKSKKYFLTDDGFTDENGNYHNGYYHRLEEGCCSKHNIYFGKENISVPTVEGDMLSIENEYYECDGERISNIYNSMEGCAELGYDPCPECIY